MRISREISQRITDLFRRKGLAFRRRTGVLPLAFVVGMTAVGAAQAYVGDSFLQVDGVKGHWQGQGFDGWVRAEAMYWPRVPIRVFSRVGDFNKDKSNASFANDRMTFGGPGGPAAGSANQLVISLGQNNPDVAALTALCTSKQVVPVMTYAESSSMTRPVLEVAPRPKDVPEYWLYTLKNARVSGCPTAEGAPDRAFVIDFENVERANWNGPEYVSVTLDDDAYPDVKPAPSSEQSRTKAFVISWFGVAADVAEEQCPVMNARPAEDDYYALMSKEEAAAEKLKNGEKGVDYNFQMGFRGPGRLSAVNLPGIVKDPGFKEPVSTTAFGVNLDGSDGSGQPPAGVCKHKNYDSVDGSVSGVDNQLFTVVGCYSGYRGKKGYRNQTSNARRADGNIVTLIEISDIDDNENDDDVTVKIIHSTDHPLKDAAGKTYFPYSTFTPTDEPQFKYFNKQFKARIVDGYVVTEAKNHFVLNTGLQDPLLEMEAAQLRLKILPDENLKGVLAGYLDWKRFMTFNRSAYSENLFGFQAPGLYNSLKRNADGLKNPQTGECDGISAAYEIDAVPAFIVTKK